ncbi:hypothetical protein BB560_005160 [Smittium megazygosporum]|uniref:Uncharacterized protein n=1 Tax=Smittium megazygosporum TaxID=133381 RepID=A0A2T9Z7D3_9FUNG|nr:hypothetical protein BB560_005160 [Smittium megazygosporum]
MFSKTSPLVTQEMDSPGPINQPYDPIPKPISPESPSKDSVLLSTDDRYQLSSVDNDNSIIQPESPNKKAPVFPKTNKLASKRHSISEVQHFSPKPHPSELPVNRNSHSKEHKLFNKESPDSKSRHSGNENTDNSSSDHSSLPSRPKPSNTGQLDVLAFVTVNTPPIATNSSKKYYPHKGSYSSLKSKPQYPAMPDTVAPYQPSNTHSYQNDPKLLQNSTPVRNARPALGSFHTIPKTKKVVVLNDNGNHEIPMSEIKQSIPSPNSTESEDEETWELRSVEAKKTARKFQYAGSPSLRFLRDPDNPPLYSSTTNLQNTKPPNVFDNQYPLNSPTYLKSKPTSKTNPKSNTDATHLHDPSTVSTPNKAKSRRNKSSSLKKHSPSESHSTSRFPDSMDIKNDGFKNTPEFQYHYSESHSQSYTTTYHQFPPTARATEFRNNPEMIPYPPGNMANSPLRFNSKTSNTDPNIPRIASPAHFSAKNKKVYNTNIQSTQPGSGMPLQSSSVDSPPLEPNIPENRSLVPSAHLSTPVNKKHAAKARITKSKTTQLKKRSLASALKKQPPSSADGETTETDEENASLAPFSPIFYTSKQSLVNRNPIYSHNFAPRSEQITRNARYSFSQSRPMVQQMSPTSRIVQRESNQFGNTNYPSSEVKPSTRLQESNPFLSSKPRPINRDIKYANFPNAPPHPSARPSDNNGAQTTEDANPSAGLQSHYRESPFSSQPRVSNYSMPRSLHAEQDAQTRSNSLRNSSSVAQKRHIPNEYTDPENPNDQALSESKYGHANELPSFFNPRSSRTQSLFGSPGFNSANSSRLGKPVFMRKSSEELGDTTETDDEITASSQCYNFPRTPVRSNSHLVNHSRTQPIYHHRAESTRDDYPMSANNGDPSLTHHHQGLPRDNPSPSELPSSNFYSHKSPSLNRNKPGSNPQRDPSTPARLAQPVRSTTAANQMTPKTAGRSNFYSHGSKTSYNRMRPHPYERNIPSSMEREKFASSIFTNTSKDKEGDKPVYSVFKTKAAELSDNNESFLSTSNPLRSQRRSYKQQKKKDHIKNEIQKQQPEVSEPLSSISAKSKDKN